MNDESKKIHVFLAKKVAYARRKVNDNACKGSIPLPGIGIQEIAPPKKFIGSCVTRALIISMNPHLMFPIAASPKIYRLKAYSLSVFRRMPSQSDSARLGKVGTGSEGSFNFAQFCISV